MLKKFPFLAIGLGYLVAAVLILLGSTVVVKSAVQQLAGLAVAQSSTNWKPLADAATGDDLTQGVMASAPYLFDGTNFDRVRGSITNGIEVDVTRGTNMTVRGDDTPASDFTNPTDALTTWSLNGVNCASCATSGWNPLRSSPTFQWAPFVKPIGGRQQSTQNDRTVSAANTATSFTITGVANATTTLYSVDAFCSAGTATLTVDDGVTRVWETPSGGIGTALFTRVWDTPLTSEANNQSIVVTLSTCGASNTGTLIVQGGRE